MANKKMHIGFFIPSMRGGGAEKVFANLANEFSHRDFKVDLVLAQKEGPYLRDVSDKINIVDLNSPRILKCLFPLASYLKNSKPDILISTLTHVNIAAIIAQKMSGSPVKIIIRQAIHYRIPKSKIKALLQQYLFKKPDKIIAVSRGVEQSLIEAIKIPRKKIKVIYNPVFGQSIIDKSKIEVHHPYFQHKKYKVILGVGRLSRQKDFATLIRAFAKIKTNAMRLIILGEGEKRKELGELIIALGLEEYISLPGFVDNPYAYMAKADVFVVSSKSEGFANVLVEAMACGTTVVSTDCPSSPAEILDYGKYGILVPVGDIQKLAEAISTSLGNTIDRNILINRAQIFSVKNSADEYQKLFYKIM